MPRILRPDEVRSAGADLDKADRAILRPCKADRMAGAACHRLANLYSDESVVVADGTTDLHGLSQAMIQRKIDGCWIRTGLAWWHNGTHLLVDRMDTY